MLVELGPVEQRLDVVRLLDDDELAGTAPTYAARATPSVSPTDAPGRQPPQPATADHRPPSATHSVWALATADSEA